MCAPVDLDAQPESGPGSAPPPRAGGGQFLNPTRMARLMALVLGGITALAQAAGWTVGGGTLTVNGSLVGDISVASGATLAGGGDIGDLTLVAGANLAPNPVVGFNVAGTLVLGGTLSLNPAYAPAPGTLYAIFNNDGSEATSGAFAGLAEGAIHTVGSTTFRVSYVGGDGNDVMLTALASTPANSDPGTSAPSSDPSPSTTPTVTALANTEITLTGITPVTAVPGSTLVIPSGTNVAGAPITLSAPSSGMSADPITFKIGGSELKLDSYTSGTTLSIKTVAVNGIDTPVLAVTSGSVSLSGAAGQPLLTLNGTSTLTAGTNGAAVNCIAGSDGSGVVVVSSGYILLSANAFAATQDGKVYAGEIAAFDSAGKITGVRLGSSDGKEGLLGDPLGGDPARVNLRGKAARDPSGQEFGDAIAALLGQSVTNLGQNNDGVLRLVYAGGTLNALPLGSLSIDTSRADGIVIRADGLAEASVAGIVATFVPAIASPSELLAALPAGSSVTQSSEGVLTVTQGGTRYRVRPAWVSQPGGTAGVERTPSGVRYGDGQDSYTLMPAFSDYAALRLAIEKEIPGAQFQANTDGTVSLTLNGKEYRLAPVLEQADPGSEIYGRILNGQRWWQDANGNLFLYAGGAVQEFVVR